MKDEKRSRLRRGALPGMKYVVGSGAAVPPAAGADGTVSVRVKGRTGWSHPHRCRHMLSSPRLTEKSITGPTARGSVENERGRAQKAGFILHCWGEIFTVKP